MARDALAVEVALEGKLMDIEDEGEEEWFREDKATEGEADGCSTERWRDGDDG